VESKDRVGEDLADFVLDVSSADSVLFLVSSELLLEVFDMVSILEAVFDQYVHQFEEVVLDLRRLEVVLVVQDCIGPVDLRVG